MTDACTFRSIDRGDIDALLVLMREYYQYDGLDFREIRARSAVQALLADPSAGGIWLIEQSGESVGYCVLGTAFSLEFHGRTAFLDELYVREEWRGKGIGAQALRFIERECRMRGLHALRLEVERANRRARQVYQHAGFSPHDRDIMTKWLKDG